MSEMNQRMPTRCLNTQTYVICPRLRPQRVGNVVHKDLGVRHPSATEGLRGRRHCPDVHRAGGERHQVGVAVVRGEENGLVRGQTVHVGILRGGG